MGKILMHIPQMSFSMIFPDFHIPHVIHSSFPDFPASWMSKGIMVPLEVDWERIRFVKAGVLATQPKWKCHRNIQDGAPKIDKLRFH